MADSASRRESGFPLRVAAVDIGSNAIRFVAVEYSDPTHGVELESRRVPVRLGHSAFLTGRLTEENVAVAVDALALFRRRLEALDVDAHRAVATSAVRESRNGAELVERARREAGLRIETITGSEEARLVWRAVRERLPLDGRWMLVDLGGGSLEVSVVRDTGIEWSESHTMGTVRLLEDLGDAGPAADRADGGDGSIGANDPAGSDDGVDAAARLSRLLEEYTRTLRLPSAGAGELRGLIATGGNIEALAELAGAEPDASGVSRLPLASLVAIRDRLSRMSYRQRVDELGLREDRADVILPAAHVYARVAEMAEATTLVVPHVGVKEGVLVDLMEDRTTHALHMSNQDREVMAAAVAMGRRYGFDEAHARQVARLALSLFDQLAGLHGLGEADRRILLGAALLHDIGQYVSYRKHHKHSLYLILNGELSVFTPAEIPRVGLVARYHRRAEPKPDHYVWEDLDDRDRDRVLKLAAILRVADALDREHLQTVVSLRATPEPGAVVLSVEGRGELLLERWALEKKGSMFQRAFGRPLRLAPA